MTEPSDLQSAHDCLRRARADVEAWLAVLGEGRLAILAPFAQMFIYQLKAQGRLADTEFAIKELYEIYYRRAGGQGAPPVAVALCGVQSQGEVAAPGGAERR